MKVKQIQLNIMAIKLFFVSYICAMILNQFFIIFIIIYMYK